MIAMTHNVRSLWHAIWGAYCQVKGFPAITFPRSSLGGSDSMRVHSIAGKISVRSGLAKVLQIVVAPIRIAKRSGLLMLSRSSGIKSRLKAVSRCVCYDIDYRTFIKNHLWEEESPEILLGYLSHEEICVLLSHLNRDVPTSFLDNKREFSEYCATHALPTPPILVKVSGDSDLQLSTGDLPQIDLFVKTEDGVCGTGCERWMRSKDDQSWRHQDMVFDGAEMVGYLESLAKQGGVLIQPVLTNHPAIEHYSNGSLATLRVVTCRSHGERPTVMVCALRMPTGTSEVDNFAAGGLAAGVSTEGVLGTAVGKGDPGKRIMTHPDTNFLFAGTKLPMFEEATALCLKAHSCFQTPYFVGWDVALLGSGPTLLEANTIWCVDLIQMAHSAPIEEFGFMNSYLKCEERRLA